MKPYFLPVKIRRNQEFERFLNWCVDNKFDVFTKTKTFEYKITNGKRVCLIFKNYRCNRDMRRLSRNYLMHKDK